MHPSQPHESLDYGIEYVFYGLILPDDSLPQDRFYELYPF